MSYHSTWFYSTALYIPQKIAHYCSGVKVRDGMLNLPDNPVLCYLPSTVLKWLIHILCFCFHQVFSPSINLVYVHFSMIKFWISVLIFYNLITFKIGVNHFQFLHFWKHFRSEFIIYMSTSFFFCICHQHSAPQRYC